MKEEGLPDPLYTVNSSPDLASILRGVSGSSELAYSAPTVRSPLKSIGSDNHIIKDG